MGVLRVGLLTWNLNENSPLPGPQAHHQLGSLMFPKLDSIPPPELVIIALQEARDVSYVEQVAQALLGFLNSRCDSKYKVASQSLVWNLGLVLVIQEHLRFKEFSSDWIGTGYLSVFVNKGALSFRFSLNGWDICVLNCHLVHGASKTAFKKRMQSLSTILKETAFFDSNGNVKRVLDHQVVFLLGDLNFRLKGKQHEVLPILSTQGYEQKLLMLDELSLNRNSFPLSLFQEIGDIQFPPTYKYKLGAGDQFSSKRVPAYTDRILYRILKETRLYKVTYSSFPSLDSSDHKPVYAYCLMESNAEESERHEIQKHWTSSSLGYYLKRDAWRFFTSRDGLLTIALVLVTLRLITSRRIW
jgi:hypothetical protein